MPTYKEFEGLDTLYVHDDLGFEYWHEVRAAAPIPAIAAAWL